MIKTTFGGQGPSSDDLAAIANEHISAVFGHPPSYYAGLRSIEPREWEALRDQAALIMARREETEWVVSAGEYRGIGLMAWFVVACLALLEPLGAWLDQIVMGFMVALGVFAQWRSTDRRRR